MTAVASSRDNRVSPGLGRHSGTAEQAWDLNSDPGTHIKVMQRHCVYNLCHRWQRGRCISTGYHNRFSERAGEDNVQS